MLLTIADFTGDYRLHNVNNPNPDLLIAIDEAQETLARELFSDASAIIANPPGLPPNQGLRSLGLASVFLPWCFLRVQLPVLAAGVNNLSDHPAQNTFPSGNFVKIAGAWKRFLSLFQKFEHTYTGIATATNIIRIPDDDPIWPQLVYPGAHAIVSGIGQVQVVSVTNIPGIGTDFTISVSTLITGQTYTIVQRGIIVKDKDFVYF